MARVEARTTRSCLMVAGGLIASLLMGCQTTDGWEGDASEWSAVESGYPTYVTSRDVADRWQPSNAVPPPPVYNPQGTVEAYERRAFPNESATSAPAFEPQTYARQQEALKIEIGVMDKIRARIARGCTISSQTLMRMQSHSEGPRSFFIVLELLSLLKPLSLLIAPSEFGGCERVDYPYHCP